MSLLPSSPRLRRRLAWSAGTLVALGAAATTIALLPGGKPLPPDRLEPGSGPTVREEREVTLTPSMRRGITRMLERFVPAAVARRDGALAWKLAGPGLRGGTTKRDWLAGRTPVFPFPVARANLDDWRPLYTFPTRVGFDLLLHPRVETRRGPIAVSVDVTRSGRRWLVDAWYVTAVFTGPDERPFVTGAPDFTANASNKNAYDRPRFGQSKLGAGWFAIPAALLTVIVLLPIGLLVAGRRRNRRAEAAYRASLGR